MVLMPPPTASQSQQAVTNLLPSRTSDPGPRAFSIKVRSLPSAPLVFNCSFKRCIV
ncbi:hypothetical protein BC940DRAFT_291218 [Gongronella butleri]|nr:hypothetical protein BC940DRAFT_291218 [Gongronella butleri]